MLSSGVGTVAALLLAGMIGSAHAQTFARLEAHPFATKTMTQEQFLKGETGKDNFISGYMRIPGPILSMDKRPAVIFMPGLGGMYSAVHDRWAEDILSTGTAVFVVDSFVGRKLYTLPEHAQFPHLVRMLDAYAALEYLRGNPRIDPNRIAILGLSGGAVASLYSSAERFRKLYGNGDMTFAAHIAIYPPCQTVFRDETKTTGKPIRIFHGLADDWNSIEPCRGYVERLKGAGQDATITELTDAHHSFDWPIFQQANKFPQVATLRKCSLEERDLGVIINAKTGRPFTPGDECVEKGTTVAYHAAAHQQTVDSVKALLTEVFGLNK